MSAAFRVRRILVGLLSGAMIAVVAIAISANDTGSMIYGCVARDGLLTVVTSPGACKKAETAIQWNTVGPVGPQGPQGPAGPQGAPGEPAPALNLTVACGSIQASVDDELDRAAHVIINITGSCDEDVVLSRPNTTLQGEGASAGLGSLLIQGAQRVSLNQLTLSRGLRADTGSAFSAHLLTVTSEQGIAVDIQTGATGTFTGLVINGCQGAGPSGCLNVVSGGSVVTHASQIMRAGRSGGIGVSASGGTIILEDTTVSDFLNVGVAAGLGGAVVMRGGAVQNNADIGVGVGMGGLVSLSDVVVEDNGWAGLSIAGGQATLSNCKVRNNGSVISGGAGITGLSGARLHLSSTTIANNVGNGVEMRDLSSLLMNQSTITGNAGHGIILGSLSFLASSNSPNAVTNNTKYGLTCAASARYRDYEAFVMSGNLLGDIAGSCTPE